MFNESKAQIQAPIFMTKPYQINRSTQKHLKPLAINYFIEHPVNR